MNRRGFLAFLGALAPGLALARSWTGAPAVADTLIIGPAGLVGLDAWLPQVGDTFVGTDRGVAGEYVLTYWQVDEDGVPREADPIVLKPR